MKKQGIFLSAFLIIGCLFTSCGKGNKLAIEDMVLTIGDVAEIIPVFTPTSAIDSLEYTIAEGGETIISIRNSIVTALAVGETKVTATGKSTSITTTFNVKVKERVSSGNPIEDFNAMGTFEYGLNYFTLTGSSAGLATTESDTDRGKDDLQFKLWTGGEIDVTLGATLNNLEAGTYTFSFALVAGAIDEVNVEINEEIFRWQDGQINVSAVEYVTTYLVYELAAEGNLDFAISFKAENRLEGETFGWGYLDDLHLDEGNTKPISNPQPQNYVLDSSFETGTDFTTTWIVEGQYSGDFKYNGADSAHTGQRGLNYWANNATNDSITLKQTISGSRIDEGSNYELKFFIINGDDKGTTSLPESYIYITQGDNHLTMDLRTITGWNAGWKGYAITSISLQADTDVEIGYVFRNTSGGYWAHMDDFQLLNWDILA